MDLRHSGGSQSCVDSLITRSHEGRCVLPLRLLLIKSGSGPFPEPAGLSATRVPDQADALPLPFVATPCMPFASQHEQLASIKQP